MPTHTGLQFAGPFGWVSHRLDNGPPPCSISFPTSPRRESSPGARHEWPEDTGSDRKDGNSQSDLTLKPMRYEPDIPGPGPWLTGCCWPQRGTGEELGEEAQGGVSKVSHRNAAVKHLVLRHQICGTDTGEPESRDN